MVKRGSVISIVSSRKSQITAFILLGIVVFAIFGLMISASNSMKKKQIESQIDIAAETITETNILQQYVLLCLKDSLNQGLTIAGKQGGVIGLPAEYVQYDGYKVSYGINNRIDLLGPIASDAELPEPPDYPCENALGTSSYQCTPTPYNWLMGTSLKMYPFGEKNLPAFCDPEGPNGANLNLFPFPCPMGTYGEDSIQEQLNNFIAGKLAECVDTKPIEDVTGIKITKGMPSVSVMFGEDEIIATASYPLNMSIGKYTSTRSFDFQTNLPVRIKKILGLADFIAKNDIFDITFNTTRDFSEYRYFGKEILPAMNVTRYRVSIGPNRKRADIIEINDSMSIIEGKSYIFRFGVENRIPALNPIPEPRQTEASFDFVVVEGDPVRMTPKAYDPDDNDEMTITYSGWKADKDERFSPIKCFDSPDECRSNPYYAVVPGERSVSGEWLPVPGEEGAVEYDTKTKNEDPVTTGCDPEDNTCNKYSRDLGAHEVKVEACDERGLCDYQIVKILVMDKPSPLIRTSDYYGNPTRTTSIEDPFILDSSGSCIFCSYASYSWEDSYGDFSFVVPSDIPDPEFDGKITIPEDMDIGNMQSSGNFFSTVEDDHVITLTMPEESAEKSSVDVKVKKCLDFDNNRNPPFAPYPYNDNNIFFNPDYAEGNNDPFKADHVCCDGGDYVTAEDEKLCYSYDSYGSFNSFTMDKFSGSSVGTDERNTGDDASKKNKKNDIFWRSFYRFCSGTRGNICSGEMQQSITVSKPCLDQDNTFKTDYKVTINNQDTFPNQGLTQTERCYGPPTDYKDTNTENPTNQPNTINCINYGSLTSGQTTFEKYYFQTAGWTGRCANTHACSLGEGDDKFGEGGNFMCEYAMCDKSINQAGNQMDSTHCDFAVNCKCNTACGADSQCKDLTYSQVNTNTGGLCKNNFYCSNKCVVVQPDASQEACNCAIDRTVAVGDKGKTFSMNLNFDASLTGHCCGDDYNEYYKKGEELDQTYACCDVISDCVYHGTCFKSGLRGGPLNDNQNKVCEGSRKKCSNGAWENDYSEIADYDTLCS
jgi:hypothetical protein